MTIPDSHRVAQSRRRIAGSVCIALLAFAFPRDMRAMPEEQPMDRDDPACITRVGSAERAALWGTPLDRIVTLRLPTTTVRASIDEMARRTGISVSYSADLLPAERSVCLAVERVPLGALLEQLLEGSALRAIVVGATSVVLAPTREAQVPVAQAAADPVVMRRTSVLDRVVVTGTPDGVAQRGSPFALDVVEGTTLSQHGVRTLGDALELSVPGIWTWATTAGSVSARFGSIRGASSFGVTAPKVYVDGIEVANPLLVMQLDANRVARVEIIRGPQGAALYGADAISGVVNVLTRYDGTTQGNTEVQLSSMVGVASASLVGRDPFVQDHAITLRTGTAARSLSAGINAGSVGEYLPGAAERRLLADINGRYSRDRAVWNGLVRFSRQEANASNGTAPLNGTGSMRDSATGQDVTQYTVGGSVSIMPSLRWTHTLISGIDGYMLHGLASTALPGPLGLNTVATLGDSNGSAHRLTTRLRSVGRFDLAPQLLATVTLGAEQVFTQESMSRAPDLSPPPMETANNNHPPGIQAPQRNAVLYDSYRHLGGLMQGTLAWRDAWFASVGGRVERTVGATPQPQTSLLPMLGLAHVRDLGDWSFKTRAAYGTGIRPARSLLRSASWMGQASAYNGTGGGGLGGAFGAPATGSNLVTASAALEAERQRGTEVGVDLLAGSRFALHVTRFDQRADGLIQAVPTVTNALTGGGRVVKSMRYTLQNVGAITNRGWEFEGTTRWAGLSLAGTMSLVDSRVAQVAQGYRGELQVGDRMFDVPARTTSLTAMWAKGRWSISSSLSHASDWMSYDRVSIGTMLSDTTDLRAVEGQVLRNYWTKQASVTRWRGALMWRVRGDLTAVMSGDNLFDVQSGAPDNTAVLVGRTLTFGIRTRF
ncbi:MAG: TonB-dependent receptor [Gemmatimonadaceae bacterium]|nr:TonB-dependent receptor [Gemmatimonadaceae bacterium]